MKGASVRMTDLAERHVPAVLELVDADRLPGQPACDRDMLAQARAGSSPIDGGWWSELDHLRVQVAIDDGEAVGAVSFAQRARDNAGVLLWLHARECRDTIDLLLDHVLRCLDGRAMVEAFSFATALGLGLEALPLGHRPVTHAALLDRGFAAADLWRYMYRVLPAPELPTAEGLALSVDDGEHTLRVLAGRQVVAEATVGAPVRGTGVLWWIGVQPAARGSRLGRRLLGSALHTLTDLGTERVILYVDDDAAADDPERSRAAANHLYDAAGFIEVDRLHSYRLTC